jgi:hypothetical protein
MEFQLRREVFYVQSVMARQGCDALARNPQMRCVVDSAVSSEVFRVFLSAIEGNAVEVTNENVDNLSALCNEFEFWSLLGRVRAFKETPTYQIKALEKQFPVEFHRGLIEDLCSARIPNSAVDDVISNCAVNLLDKRGHAGK